MQQEEKHLTAEDSLRVIRESIDLAKRNVRENGFHFLWWGWLVIATSLVDYYLWTVLNHPRHQLVWAVMCAVGVPVAMIYEWRKSRRNKVENLIHNWYGYLWLGYGISLALGIPAAVSEQISPIPFILILTGFATFITGVILRFLPLRVGAVFIWAGALCCIFLNPAGQLVAQAVSAAIGYLIPGHMLDAQYRKHNA